MNFANSNWFSNMFSIPEQSKELMQQNARQIAIEDAIRSLSGYEHEHQIAQILSQLTILYNQKTHELAL